MRITEHTARLLFRAGLCVTLLLTATACGKREALQAQAEVTKAALDAKRAQMDQLRKEAEAVFARKRAPSTLQKETEHQRKTEQAKTRKNELDREIENVRSSLKKLQSDHQEYRRIHLSS